jgi:hypothetical protein
MIDPFFSEVHGRHRQQQLLREAELARTLRTARRPRRVTAQAHGGARGWAAIRWGLGAAGGLLVATGTWLQQVGLPPLTETDQELLTTS